MTGYLKKNQKKLMALFSVGLMIAFALPSAVTNMQKNREVPVGYASGGATVTNKEVAEARGELEVLREIVFERPADPSTGRASQPVNVLEASFGSNAGTIVSNPELYVLLKREAERAGVTVSPDEVMNNLRARMTAADNERVSDEQRYAAMEGLLAVDAAARLAQSSGRASRPEVADLISHAQEMSLNLVEFKAQDYLSKVPQWSDAERAQRVDKQYEAYKDFEPTTRPAAPGSAPDFAFGYRVANRVRVQYIEVTRDAARAAAKAAIEKEGPLDVAAARYFQQHPQEFPASQPAGAKPLRAMPPPPTVANPATQPTSKPALAKVFTDEFNASARPATFKAYVYKARDAVIDERAGKLTNDVLADISNQMARDFAAFRHAYGDQIPPTATSMPTTAPGAVPKTPLGVAYDDDKYLAALADAEQKQFGLRPATHEDKGLRTEKQLADEHTDPISGAALKGYDLFSLVQMLGGFNQASFQQAQQMAPIAKFPLYVTRFVGPLVNDQVRNLSRMMRLPILDLYAPSPVFLDAGDLGVSRGTNNAYIVRVVEADPSHPAPKAEVAEQVLTDARLAAAYALARQDAAAFAAEAQKSHLQAAAFGSGRRMVTTGQFDLRSSVITGYLIDQRAVPAFMTAAYDLLNERGAQKTDHPVGVMDLKPTATVLVGEVNSLRPQWTADTLAAVERQAAMSEEGNRRGEFRAVWFSQSDIQSRNQYKPVEGTRKSTQTPAPQQNQPPADNPFSVVMAPWLFR